LLVKMFFLLFLSSIWRTKIPSKVAFFAWSAALGKILTMDNIKKRHIIVVDRCCLCKQNGESMDHFFSIVRFHVPYGMLSSIALGCPGLCLLGWLICLLAGGRAVALGILLCEKWCLITLCGACVGNKMTEISRTKKRRCRSSSPFSFILFLLGQQRF